MTSFFSADIVVGATPVSIVSPVDFDRTILVRTIFSDIFVGLASSATHFRLPSGGSGSSFILPADEELWAATATTPGNIYVFAGGV